MFGKRNIETIIRHPDMANEWNVPSATEERNTEFAKRDQVNKNVAKWRKLAR